MPNMRGPRYPLEPLIALREEAVDAAVRGLARAVRERELAEQRREGAERAHDLHAQTSETARASENTALERGELRASDLAAARAWEARVAAESDALKGQVRGATGAESSARDAERGAGEAVATRQADAQVVEKHRERWADGLQKRAAAKEEEEAAEARRPQR